MATTFYRSVAITSSNTKQKYPSFTGILYKARDNPVADELTLSSAELENLDLAGEPVCVEHDKKLGRVGVILASRFEAPNLIIEGKINTENREIRESVRERLVDGRLSELSIGFHAIQNEKTGRYQHKVFDEASLVKAGYYDGTRIVSIKASINGGSEVSSAAAGTATTSYSATMETEADKICALIRGRGELRFFFPFL